MSNIKDIWEKERIAYQFRYARACKRFKETNSESDRGAMLEMSYVLHTVFGLSDKQVDEVEKNNGLTNKDIYED